MNITINKQKDTYIFGGTDMNIKIINGIRRIMKKFIPTLAFNKKNITIIENTSIAYNNSYMIDRLSQLPVILPNIKLDENPIYEMYIDYENKEDMYNLTTNNAEVKLNGKSVKYDKEILLLKMIKNSKFKAHLKADINIGNVDVIYDACANVWYSILKDNKYELFIELDNNQTTKKDLLIATCNYFILKFESYIDTFKHNLDNKMFIDDKNKDIIITINDDISLAYIINEELRHHTNVVLSGVSKLDQFVNESQLKIICDQTKIHEIINEVLTKCIKKFTHIKNNIV
jgi:hypothetical protein